jgi:hypothetical protein
MEEVDISKTIIKRTIDQSLSNKTANHYESSSFQQKRQKLSGRIKENHTISNGIPAVASKISSKNQQKLGYTQYQKPTSNGENNTFSSIIESVLPEIAKDIMDLEKLKLSFINTFKRAVDFDIPLFTSETEADIFEPKLVYSAEAKTLEGLNIAAVDGSIVSRNFYGLDISLSRAIGVIYDFHDVNRTKKPIITYVPDSSGVENYKLNSILLNTSEQDSASQLSIERALMEIKLANDIVQNSKKDIDMLILDGSILTEPLNLLSYQNDALLDKYAILTAEYRKLYNLCDSQNVLLVGPVKDTRSSTFRKFLSNRLPSLLKNNPDLVDITSINYRKLMNYFSDIDFFHRLLNPGYRSCVFSLNSAANSWLPRQLDLLEKDISKDKTSMYDFDFLACYLKPVKYDLPVRLEFCINKKDLTTSAIHDKIEQIISIILPLSTKLDNFAIPIPQIEAHKRAVLSENDLNTVVSLLDRKIVEELNAYSMESDLQSSMHTMKNQIDDLIVKNHFMLNKRRERLPI